MYLLGLEPMPQRRLPSLNKLAHKGDCHCGMTAWWLIYNSRGQELARVYADDEITAAFRAMEIPAVIISAELDDGFGVYRLRWCEL